MATLCSDGSAKTSRIVVLVSLALLAVGCSQRAYTDAELYVGFTSLDATTRSSIRDSWLIVRDGLIEQVGAGSPPEGDYAAIHDVSGLFGLPGFIDAHGHITAGPQRITIVEGAPRIEIVSGDEYSRSNAAVALASGVTTIRNPAGSTAANARYDAMIAAREWIGPDAYHAGAVIQPPPFIGESFVYPQSVDEWHAEAARQARAGMTYFKLYVDLTEDELAAGVAAAKANGLTPIAHLNSVSWTRAIELGVEQLEHALPTSPALLEPEARGQFSFGPDFMTRWFELADYSGPLMTQLIDMLVTHQVEIDLTLQVNELTYHADRLDSVFPELTEGLHPDMMESMERSLAALAAVPPEQLARGRAVWPKVLELAGLMHAAGVRMMIGTDGTGGGPTYAHELENHVRAGIASWEVLRMATSGNAELMGLTNTGRLLPGFEADIVFLRSNPSGDIRAIREVELVVTNGVPHQPRALVGIAREIASAARTRSAN